MGQKNQNRDWRNVIFIDEWTFYLKTTKRKEMDKKVIIILMKKKQF